MTPPTYYKIHYQFPGGKTGVYQAEYTKELVTFWLDYLARKDTLGVTYWAEPVGGGEKIEPVAVKDAN